MPEISEDAAPAAIPPAEELNALSAGTRFGELEILRTLAVGGFGIVYLAQDHALERQVAIKEYMPGQLAQRGSGSMVSVRSAAFSETFETGRRSFVNEARLLARFDHPALLKVYRFWEGNGTAYMLMPYLQGQTLKQVRQEMKGRPTEEWLRSVLRPVLDALELLHAESIYHRDISPDNILLPEGGGDPILLDFGAARHAIGDGTQTLTAILKPRFAPIEQYGESAALRQGPWTDLYALGAVAYYLLLGHTPPAATTRTIADSYQPLARMGLTEYSPEFLAAIDWSLGVRPQDRPASAPEMWAALEGLVHPPAPNAASPIVDQWEHTLSLPDDVAEDKTIELPARRARTRRAKKAKARRASRSYRSMGLIAAVALAAAGLTWWAMESRRSGDDAVDPAAEPVSAVSDAPPATERARPADAKPPAARPSSHAQPAPGDTAAATAPPTTAKPLDPLQECSGKAFIARDLCLERQCQKPAYASHAECVKLRGYRGQRERYGT